jgi:hypothetical protein
MQFEAAEIGVQGAGNTTMWPSLAPPTGGLIARGENQRKAWRENDSGHRELCASHRVAWTWRTGKWSWRIQRPFYFCMSEGGENFVTGIFAGLFFLGTCYFHVDASSPS